MSASPAACGSADPTTARPLSPEQVKSRILPPVEIEAHAQALGWTPESRVWANPDKNGFWVFPSRKYLHSDGSVTRAVYKEASFGHEGEDCTLLPNRTVPADPLDQLAAEAQAEGEDAAPKRQLCKHPEFMRGLQMPGPNDHGRVWCGVCGHHFIGKPPEPKPQPPTPRRTAREVAEEVLCMAELAASNQTAIDAIEAAIERDRQQRPEVRDKAP